MAPDVVGRNPSARHDFSQSAPCGVAWRSVWQLDHPSQSCVYVCTVLAFNSYYSPNWTEARSRNESMRLTSSHAWSQWEKTSRLSCPLINTRVVGDGHACTLSLKNPNIGELLLCAARLPEQTTQTKQNRTSENSTSPTCKRNNHPPKKYLPPFCKCLGKILDKHRDMALVYSFCGGNGLEPLRCPRVTTQVVLRFPAGDQSVA